MTISTFRRILVLAPVLFVAACASSSNRATQVHSDPFPRELSLMVASNRYAELEPCGCSMAPLGGLQRERNLLDRWAKEGQGLRWFVNTGTTFVPAAKDWQPSNMSYFRLKARYLAKAMDQLGVAVLAPTIDDLALGEETLRELRNESGFAWVGTNLYDRSTGKPLFAPYVEHRFEGGSVYFLGLSHGPSATYQVDGRFEARDPAESLKGTLASLPPGRKLVVVLTSLPKAQREKLMDAFPEVHLLLGGAYEESTWSAHLHGNRTIYGVPTDLARAILRVDLNLAGDPPRFVSSLTGKTTARQLEGLRAELGRKGLSRKQKAAVEAEIKKLEALPKAGDPETSPYTGKLQVLGPEFDEPKNELTKTVDEFKEKVRGLALRQSES